MKKDKTQKIRIVFRDSDKGQFVTPEYARRYPKTTERQHIRVNNSPSSTRSEKRK